MSQVTGFRYSMREEKNTVKSLGRGQIVRTNKRNWYVIALGAAEFLISYRSVVAVRKAVSDKETDTVVYGNGNYTEETKRGVRWCSPTTRGHVYDFGGHNAEIMDGDDFVTMVETIFPELLGKYRLTGSWGI